MPTPLSVVEDFEPPYTVAGELPPDIFHALAKLAGSNDVTLPRADPVGPSARPLLDGQPYFEIYRADEVSLTSVLFSGGDWRWRFCANSGAEIAASAGYASERDCVAAVAALRDSAATAQVRTGRPL